MKRLYLVRYNFTSRGGEDHYLLAMLESEFDYIEAENLIVDFCRGEPIFNLVILPTLGD